MSITASQALRHYGPPEKERFMVLWDVPSELEIGSIPKKIYCNRDMVIPLQVAFRNMIERGCVKELRDWAGCFNIRRKRGGISSSLHSWGLAVDMNPTDNQMGYSRERLRKMGRRPFSDEFVQCWKDAGFNWGGDWRIPDCMHMELSRIP
jgi:hypothetical protein